MKLIVGLGNKGKEYDNTRHNVGFMAIDKIAEENNIIINQEKFQGIYGIIVKEQEKIILLKPQKYMNLSGEVIKKYIDYFNININDIFIISDDLDMSFGKLRLKHKGSSGGHNGLKNIEQNLKTDEYKRLKIGISNNKNIETKDYVLGKLNQEEIKILKETLKTVPNIFNDFLSLNFDILINKYNRK